MEEIIPTDKLSNFLESGIYRFESSNAVFIDPVRVLNRSYTSFRVSSSTYYSRFFESKHADEANTVSSDKISRKRKRKQRRHQILNEREQVADQRHQRVRPLLMEAHESLLGASDLLAVVRNLREDFCSSDSKAKIRGKDSWTGVEQSFVELGRVWQAPLFEITVDSKRRNKPDCFAGNMINQCDEERVLPLFNCLVGNMTSDDAEAKVLDRRYIIPRESSFYMSDLGQIHNAIPADSDCGYNFIIIDPPWENGSAYQKSMPYERLLLGYCDGVGMNSEHLSKVRPIKDNQVVISIPGDYSRKPPIGDLLLEHVPGLKPTRCIELFAREMMAGWVSWGNEPLYFQESGYFQQI